MRSASVSPMPYIMVTDVFMPSSCASSMISSQRSAPAFLRRDLVAHALHEDLTAAARDGIEPGLLQLADHVGARPCGSAWRRSPPRSARSRGCGWGDTLDVAQQVEVPLERDVRIVPALDEDLHAAERLGLLDLLADLLERERVPFAVLRATVEGAEAAVGHADVRVVDVAVDDVRDDAVRMQRFAAPVGLEAEFEQRGVGVEVEQVAHAKYVRWSRSGGREEGERAVGHAPAPATSRRKNSVSPARCG